MKVGKCPGISWNADFEDILYLRCGSLLDRGSTLLNRDTPGKINLEPDGMDQTGRRFVSTTFYNPTWFSGSMSRRLLVTTELTSGEPQDRQQKLLAATMPSFCTHQLAGPTEKEKSQGRQSPPVAQGSLTETLQTRPNIPVYVPAGGLV